MLPFVAPSGSAGRRPESQGWRGGVPLVPLDEKDQGNAQETGLKEDGGRCPSPGASHVSTGVQEANSSPDLEYRLGHSCRLPSLALRVTEARSSWAFTAVFPARLACETPCWAWLLRPHDTARGSLWVARLLPERGSASFSESDSWRAVSSQTTSWAPGQLSEGQAHLWSS